MQTDPGGMVEEEEAGGGEEVEEVGEEVVDVVVPVGVVPRFRTQS